MEVQNNPDTNELTDAEIADRLTAKPGGRYPIRLLHMTNGMLIIGFVINVFPETSLILRPYVVEADYDPQKDNIDEYEFTPYLNQLVDYNALDLSPISFMNSAIIAIAIPAQHLLENYTHIIRLREAVAATEDQTEIHLYKRNYVNPNTKH